MREKIESARLVRIHSRRYWIRDTGLAIYQNNPAECSGKNQDADLWRVGAALMLDRTDYNQWMTWALRAQLHGKTFDSKEAALKAVDGVNLPFPL